MNVGKMLLAAAVGGVVYFLLGWAVWGVALANFFKHAAEVEALIQRPPEEFGLVSMLLSCLAWGVLFAYIFSRWAGIRTFASGAVAGATIAVLVSLSVNFGMLAMYKSNFTDPTKLVADAVVSGVVSAIVGGVIGWMLGRGEKA